MRGNNCWHDFDWYQPTNTVKTVASEKCSGELFWFLSKVFFLQSSTENYHQLYYYQQSNSEKICPKSQRSIQILSSQSSTKNTAKLVASEKRFKAMWRALLVLVKRFSEQSAAENHDPSYFYQQSNSQRSVLNFKDLS